MILANWFLDWCFENLCNDVYIYNCQLNLLQVYYLEVYTKEYSWLVARRYREFYELHEKVSSIVI